MISSCAGTDALCLRNIRHSATPYSAFNTSPIFARSRSELNFVFSISPTRLPSSDAGRSTYAMACRSEEHTSELQSQSNLVCRLLLEKKNIHDVSFTQAVMPFHKAADAHNPILRRR